MNNALSRLLGLFLDFFLRRNTNLEHLLSVVDTDGHDAVNRALRKYLICNRRVRPAAQWRALIDYHFTCVPSWRVFQIMTLAAV